MRYGRSWVMLLAALGVGACATNVDFGNVSPEVNLTLDPPPQALLADEAARARRLQHPLFANNPALVEPNRTYHQWFRLMPYHRVFMASADGAFGGAVRTGSLSEAVSAAERDCQSNRERRNLRAPCVIVAVNDTISNDLANPVSATAGAPVAPVRWGIGPFLWVKQQDLPPEVVGGRSSLASNPSILWGPQAAKGVIVWSHGFNGLNREQRFGGPFPIVMELNLAGWDVLRFDREPGLDMWDQTINHYHRRLPLLKQAGYKRVVLAGQSLGGSLALSLLTWQNAGEIDGVLSIAGSIPRVGGSRLDPLNMGAAGTAADSQGRMDNWRRFVDALQTTARVVQVGFQGDELAQFAAESHAYARQLLPAKGVPYMSIVPANTQRFRGHGAGSGTALALDYGRCVRLFLEEGARDSSCPADAVTPGR